jgi:hypothetical protein
LSGCSILAVPANSGVDLPENCFMKATMQCPACHQTISFSRLFRTGTLFRFKCPHCREIIRPESFDTLWFFLLISVLAGLAFGSALLYVYWPSVILALIVAVLAIKALNCVAIASTTKLIGADRKLEGRIEGKLEALLQVLERRFAKVPHDLEATIRSNTDLRKLEQWIDVALQSEDLNEFRRHAQL